MSNTYFEPKFQEFSWEQRKVTELGKIYIGLVTTMTAHYTDEGTLLIRNSDIKDGRFEFGENPIFLEKSFAMANESRMHQIGDVITVHTGDVGTSAVISENEDKSIGFATIVTRPNKTIIDPSYLCTFLNTERHKKWAVAISTGDGRTNYNLGDYFELVVPVPSIKEQKQIAMFIENLNHLIALHQRKYDKLTNVKKSMLEKMFPKNGSNVPEIRFKGFTEAWEQRKLGDIGETYTGLSGKTKVDFGHGQARFVTYMNVFSNPISNPEITEPIEIDPKQNEVEVGDVFFTTSSETPEEVGMSSVLLEKRGKTYLNSFCFGFRPSEKIDSYYLAYMLRSESARDKIILLAQGISRYNISKNKVMEIAVSLPSLDEQKLIGQYFRQLDNLITLHQRELEKLKNLKKACLEKMFV